MKPCNEKMFRSIGCALRSLIGVCAAMLASQGSCRGQDAKAAALTLADVAAGRARIVDLAYSLNETTNFWPGDKYSPFRLETIATLGKDGVLSKAMCLPEHIGTHLDAPNHFEANQPDVSEIAAEQLFAEGVVIDISMQAEQSADYRLSVEDVEFWEQSHGPIPPGSIILLKTGWSRYWNEPALFHGRDVQGVLHFPSYSPEAARLLIHERQVKGLGVDTLSIDAGRSKTFEVHHIVNAAGRYGIENVAHLEELPARGFYLVVAPMKVEAGTGGPARVFAIMPGDSRNDGT